MLRRTWPLPLVGLEKATRPLCRDRVPGCLCLVIVRLVRDRVHDPACSQNEPEDSGSTVPRAVRGRQFQHDMDAPGRMGSPHRRRPGLRMGVVGPLAPRAGAEVGSKEDGSDDQTASTATTAAPPPPAELVPSTPEPDIEEVFVISSNSLLIKHMSRSLMSDKDRDVVGSMISAISSFVREAFTERDGEVHEVTLGDHRFVMCSDRGIVLAVLVSSGDTEDIVHRLRHLLAILDDRYGDRLATWQGESLEGIEDELQVLWQPYHLPPPPPAT